MDVNILKSREDKESASTRDNYVSFREFLELQKIPREI